MNEKLIFKAVCERDFSFFSKQMLKVIEPETNFLWNWHMDELCKACEEVHKGTYPKLDVNMPPRMLKSLIVNVLFPTWIWTKDPSKKFLCASGSYNLSIDFNIKRRDLITSDLYQSIWPIRLKDDKNRNDSFSNEHGGLMHAVSSMGRITGKGGDYQISDDLIDAMDSFSKTKREAVKRWYNSAFYNRAQDKKTVKRININQRLHQQDISAELREKGFQRMVLEMVKTDKNESTIEFNDPREVGDLLFPKRYGISEMEDDKKVLGSYGWSSQYQQRPSPMGGGIIKREWLRFYDKVVSFNRIIITGDLTFKGTKTSDYVSFMAWGSSGNDKYLIDVVRGKWSYKETKDRFRMFCDKHRNAQVKYIEDKANGSALISDLKDEISRIRAWPEKGSNYISADKIERLHLVQPEFEMGQVYFPKDIELMEEYIEELLGFTDSGSTTGHDDMVDTTTMALLELKKTKTFFQS